MKLRQISVFLENRPGRLGEPCRVLAEAGINIITLSLADTEQFGIMRLIVRDWELAKSVLETNGWVTNLTDVLAVEVQDKPGGLANVLSVLEGQGLNIEYMYALNYHHGDLSALVFRFDDPDAASACIREAGLNLIGSLDGIKDTD